MELPPQPPEVKLIDDLRQAIRPKLSVRKAAELAGLSEGRWRQLVKGYNQATKDTAVPTNAPAETLARMARVVGATPDQLREVGREDAAHELANLATAHTATARGVIGTPTTSARATVHIPNGPTADIRHIVDHTWSVASEFVVTLVEANPAVELWHQSDRLVWIFGTLIADRVMKSDIPTEDKDAILADLYQKRRQARLELESRAADRPAQQQQPSNNVAEMRRDTNPPLDDELPTAESDVPPTDVDHVKNAARPTPPGHPKGQSGQGVAGGEESQD